MAQTGYTPIQLYYSSTTTNVPLAASLANGELAINITDGKLFYKDNAAAVQVIGWKTTPTSAGGTGLTSYTAGDTLYYASGTTLSKLAIGATDYVLTSSGSAPQWSASLKAIAGGTGQTSYAVGDLLYANTTTTLAKLADVATGNALISGGIGVAPSYGKIGLTTHVSGTLPVANGGTNLTSFTANGIMYASSTSALATGSALTFDGTNFATTGNASASAFIPTSATIPTNGIYYPAANTTGIASNSTGRFFFSSSFKFYAGVNQNLYFFGANMFANGNTLACVNDAFSGYVELELRGSTIGFHNGSSEIGRFDTTNLIPGADNSASCGSAAKRWSVIYAGNGTINTSDQNEKTDFLEIEQTEKEVALSIKSKLKKFRYKDAVASKGDDARIHFGAVAQEVEQCFKDKKLNPARYGMFCVDQWYEKEIKKIDDLGNEVTYIETSDKPIEGAISRTRMGLRYDQLLAFVIAAI
jgi:hypothetical protein